MRGFVVTLQLGIRNLTLHKLRSLLTVLGLVFGVASVIVMLAVAEGASQEAQRQIEELGATNVIVRSVKPIEDAKEKREDRIFEYGLRYDDLERIQKTIPTVLETTPLREFPQTIRHLDRQLDGRLVGVTPDYAAMNRLAIEEGRFISELDCATYANVAVIGPELAEKLFGFENAVGRSVRIGFRNVFRVVGVAAKRAPSAATGGSLTAQDYAKDCYVPLPTDRVRFGETLRHEGQGSFNLEKLQLSQITLRVDAMDNVKPTAAVLESLLGQFHPKKDFGITVPLELLEKAEATKRVFNMVLGSIAGISLLVGGIGIMNIMLATVTERTREIGIRRALGARRSDITRQFLVETAVLSATGGMLGVAVGFAVPPLVAKASGMAAVIPSWAPIVAFGISVSVGIAFGIYPARRAAFLDPIEALRAE